ALRYTACARTRPICNNNGCNASMLSSMYRRLSDRTILRSIQSREMAGPISNLSSNKDLLHRQTVAFRRFRREAYLEDASNIGQACHVKTPTGCATIGHQITVGMNIEALTCGL